MSDKPAVGHRRAADTWKRWEMRAFEKPAPAPAAASVAAVAPVPDLNHLRKEVERLRDAAQTRGHAEGYAAGHAQGLAEGNDAGHASGHQQGYDAGYAAGHQAGYELAAQEAAHLQTLAQACTGAIESVHAEMGQALIALSIKIAEQVLRSTLQTYPDKILDLIHDVMQVDNGKEALVKLRLNPEDLDLVEHYLHTEGVSGSWRLLPDSSIERGGCIAETALGSIDATLQTRWQRVIASLGHQAALDGKA